MTGIAKLDLDLYAKFSHSLDAHLFVVVIMAIDSKQQIGNQSREDLHHQAVLCSCNEVIDLEVAFPPCKKLLNQPNWIPL